MTGDFYTARSFRPEEDREELLRLWADNMSDPGIRDARHERMRWLYDENPSGCPRTWIAVAADDRGIGCGSLCPRRVLVGGRLMNAGILTDFAIDRRHRLAGAAIILQRTIMASCREAGFDFLMGWPNAKSVAVLKRIGYSVVGSTRSWVKPLRTTSRLGDMIASRLGTRLPAWVTPDLLAHLGGPVLDQALFTRDCVRRLASLPRMQVTLADRVDHRIDCLWAQTTGSPIVGEKTSDYLNWRYSGFPTERYRYCLLMERRSDKVLGYAAYSLRGDVAFIVDLFVQDLDRHVEPLLLGFAAAMRWESVRGLYLTYLGTKRLGAHLRRVGFFDRGGDRPLIIWLPPGTSDDLRVRVTDPENWLMTDGELDL